MKEIATNTERRYDQILETLRQAPRRRPGDRVVTATAKTFVEKRAALQAGKQEKVAAGVAPGIFATLMKMVSSGAAKAPAAVKGQAAQAAQGGLSGLGLFGAAAGLGGLGIAAGPTLDAWGERLRYKLAPTTSPEQMLYEGANAFAKSVGGQAGQTSVDALSNLLAKAVGGVQDLPQALSRHSLFTQLQREDDVLSQADPGALQEAYHTMVRFAPTLATDKNAVRSFLRESALYGTGPNVVTIKQLADAERASTGE